METKNQKIYVFENLPKIQWRQKNLTYPEFEQLKKSFIAFVESMNPENDLLSTINSFLSDVLKQSIPVFIHPYRSGFFGNLVQWLIIKIKKVDVNNPIQYMTLSEVAQVIADFFFLSGSWMKNFSGSLKKLDMIPDQILTKATEMIEKFPQANSSGSSQIPGSPSIKS